MDTGWMAQEWQFRCDLEVLNFAHEETGFDPLQSYIPWLPMSAARRNSWFLGRTGPERLLQVTLQSLVPRTSSLSNLANVIQQHHQRCSCAPQE